LIERGANINAGKPAKEHAVVVDVDVVTLVYL
jgi:hypothetical protein